MDRKAKIIDLSLRLSRRLAELYPGESYACIKKKYMRAKDPIDISSVPRAEMFDPRANSLRPTMPKNKHCTCADCDPETCPLLEGLRREFAFWYHTHMRDEDKTTDYFRFLALYREPFMIASGASMADIGDADAMRRAFLHIYAQKKYYDRHGGFASELALYLGEAEDSATRPSM